VTDISILVAGTGFWGNEWLRVLSATEGVVIGATAGHRDPEIPDDAPLAPGYRHYDDYQEAVADASVDALVITLPTRLHADAIQRGIDAGLHVLCEKPLAQNAEETAHLLAAAAKRPDLVVMVSQNYRWRPWAQAVEAAIADGTVGGLAHIDVRFSQPEFLAGQRMELANPLLQDMAIHHFDLMRFLAGANAVEFYAREYTPFWNKFPGSPSLDAVIAMQNGVPVNYSGTWAGRGGVTTWDGEWTIQGERGLLTVSDGRVALHPDAGTFDASGKGTIEAPEPVSIPLPDLPSGDLQSSLEDFLRAIESGTEPTTSITDNCHSIAMVFAAEESLRAGRPVQVESWTDVISTGTTRQAAEPAR
jgi:predicted dehydrogenase